MASARGAGAQPTDSEVGVHLISLSGVRRGVPSPLREDEASNRSPPRAHVAMSSGTW